MLWFAVAFEILFLIIANSAPKKNYCYYCKASNCIVPLNSPAGETVYQDFYKEETIDELEKKQKLIIENNIKSSKDIWKNYFVPVITIIFVTGILLILIKNSPTANNYKETYKKEAKLIEEKIQDVSVDPNITYKNIKFKEVYKYPQFGIYVYQIEEKYVKNNPANINELFQYSLNLAHGEANFKNVYFFCNDIDVKALEEAPKRLPANLLLEIWKDYPYLEISSYKDNQENICVYNGYNYDYFHLNLVLGTDWEIEKGDPNQQCRFGVSL